MRFIERITSYFMTFYKNNSKYRNNFTSYLKLFFERDSKTNISYTYLGNLFKNSKWTNLRTQNIKKAFLEEIIILTLILISLAYYGNGNILVGFKRFCSVDLVKTYFFVQEYFYIFFSLTAYWLSTFILRISGYRIIDVDLNQKPAAEPSKRPKKFKKKKSTQTNHDNTLATDLYKAKKNLHKIDINPNEIKKLKRKMLKKNLDSGYFLTSDNLKFNPILRDIKLKELNLLNDSKFFLSIDNNYKQDLNMLKTNRWLLKNSLLSEGIVKNTNNYTEVKKLFGSNVLSTSLRDHNVWASTNLNKLNFLTLSEYPNSEVTSLKINSNRPDTGLQFNYNFFDESRLFLIKKYYFTSSSGLNNFVFNDKYLGNIEHSPTQYNKLDLLYLLNNLSLNQNISDIYLNTSIVLDSNPCEYDLNSFDKKTNNSFSSILTGNNLILVNNIYTSDKSLYYSYFKY